jgi:hypothetical protein
MNLTNYCGMGFAVITSVALTAPVSEEPMPVLKTVWSGACEDAGYEAALARAVAEYPLSNAVLLASVERCRPPQSWYDEDHEGLY